MAFEDGAAAAWGASDFGQCGLDTTATQAHYPRLIKGVRESHVARAAAGGNHTLLLATSGEVYSCGDGTFGEWGGLGQGRDGERGRGTMQGTPML